MNWQRGYVSAIGTYVFFDCFVLIHIYICCDLKWCLLKGEYCHHSLLFCVGICPAEDSLHSTADIPPKHTNALHRTTGGSVLCDCVKLTHPAVDEFAPLLWCAPHHQALFANLVLPLYMTCNQKRRKAGLHIIISHSWLPCSKLQYSGL